MGSPVIWFGTKGKVLASGGLVDVNGLPIGGSLPVSNKNTAFTATAGNSYLVDTSSTAITVTLPAGAAHATMRFYDAAGYWSSNNIILTPATGEKFRGLVANDTLVGDVNAAWIELVWDVTNSQWQYATNGFSIGSGGGSSSAGGLVPTYKVANFTAATNFNYLVNTTSAGITATLPAGATGATIRFTDDAGTWKQNNLTITPATGEKFQGQTANDTLVCDLANGWVELNWDATNSQWTVSSNGVAASTYTGPIVTDWVPFTMSITAATTAPTKGTIVQDEARYRRIGDTMEIQYTYYQNAAGAAGSGVYYFNLPSGLHIDTAKLSVGVSTATTLGHAYAYNGTTEYTGSAYPQTSTAISLLLFTSISASTFLSNSNVSFANTQARISFSAKVPILEWASQNNIAYQNDVEYAYNSAAFANGTDSTSFAYGKVGQAMATITTSCVRRVRFTSSIQDGDRIKLQVQGVNAGSTWLDADALGMNLIQQGSFAYGHQINGVTGSTTDVDIYFYQYAQCTGSTYGSAGTNWNSNWKWRLVKSSGGQVVGFGIVVPGTSAGLVSANGLTGNVTGNAIASGYVGEVIKVTGNGALSGTSGTAWVNRISQAMTAGKWLVFAGAGNTTGGITQLALVVSDVGTVATAAPTDAVEGYNYTGQNADGILDRKVSGVVFDKSTAWTLYAVTKATYTSGSINCNILAVRIA